MLPSRIGLNALGAAALCIHWAVGLAQTATEPTPPRSTGIGGTQQSAPLPPAPAVAPGPVLIVPRDEPRPPEQGRLSAQMRVAVRKFAFEGNTVFSSEELGRVTAPYEGRTISSDELLEARDRLTLHYVEQGYVNSGAVIPDQEISEGVIRVRIVEGELTAVEVAGLRRLEADYVAGRVRLAAGPPLNLNALQSRLLVLQQEPAIDRLNAELAPGTRPGESVLRIDVSEANPSAVAVGFANDNPVSTGSTRAWLSAAHRNVSGRADTIALGASLGWGSETGTLAYLVPLNARDTKFGVYWELTTSSVVEEPFDALDIESRTESFGISLSHPLVQDPGRQLILGLSLQHRRNDTRLLGAPFSFLPGARDGTTKVTVLRFSQDWLQRGRDEVIAARSTFTAGLDAADATRNAHPDGQFFSWLGQFQWVNRFVAGGLQSVVRGDLQLANDALLPLEQFAMGGVRTVRGYRENQLIRDNGLVVSGELRIPLNDATSPARTLQLALFADYGRAWNENSSPQPRYLSSVGAGVHWSPTDGVQMQLQWGHRLRSVTAPNRDLQDRGIHFALTFQIP